MKKNKTVAFMLAATLMVGGTFLGTKAWFTDNATASNDLVVTMGTLDINTNQNTSEWTVVNNNNKTNTEALKTEQTKNTFTNASTNDTFKKTITITNSGTLKQKVTVSELKTKANQQKPDDVTVSYKIDGSDGNTAQNRTFELAAGATKDIEIEVTFNERGTKEVTTGSVTEMVNKNKLDIEGSYNISGASKKSFNFGDIYETIVVTAEQVSNKPIQTPAE